MCDEHNFGLYQERCAICDRTEVSDAYCCKECKLQEKDGMVVQKLVI